MCLVAAETISAETSIVDGLDETMLNCNENAVELPNRTVSSGFKEDNFSIMTVFQSKLQLGFINNNLEHVNYWN